MAQHHLPNEGSCPFSGNPEPTPTEGSCPFSGTPERLVMHNPSQRALEKDLAAYNSPDPESTPEMLLRLSLIVDNWTSSDTFTLEDGDLQYLMLGWTRFRAALKAISSTDFILQWNDSESIVERPGQRIHGRRKELSALVENVTVGEERFEWGSLSEHDKKNIACLMLLCLSGAPLEEANGLKSVTDAVNILAHRLCVLEKIAGKSLFATEDSQNLLQGIASFSTIEKETLNASGLLKVVLVEGTRTPFYTPHVLHAYDTSTLTRIAHTLGVTTNDTAEGHADLAPQILEHHSLDTAIFAALIDSHYHLADESFLVVRPNQGPVALGDQIFGWAVVGGRCFKADAVVIEKDGELRVEMVHNASPFDFEKDTTPNMPWRRSLETLTTFEEGTPEKIINFRRGVIEAEQLDNDEYRNNSTAQGLLADAARRLFNRLLEHNLTASANGRQQGATVLQPGWHLSYDSNSTGTGYGKLNNPGHAMAGVQTMIRAPLYGSAFSHLRIWRERADWEAQFTLAHIREFSAYHFFLDAVSRSFYENRSD